MWAQDWSNIYDLLVPYPNATSTNLTKLLIENNYTVHKMFKVWILNPKNLIIYTVLIYYYQLKEAEKFFTSMGLFNMTDDFWAKSMLEKPSDDIEVDCHGSAFDFYSTDDFR